MTLQEKIGQLFILGFEGTRPARSITQLIKKAHVGGVILFARNLKNAVQIAKLTNALQSLSPRMPLLIAVDQEGGRVSRLPKEFTRFPSAAAIGAARSTELAYRAADCTARELRAVGINMNLAPVLDVKTHPANQVIGDRAFGSDPALVGRMGLAVMAGLQDNRVAACGKHFPGHGATQADSHEELPTFSHSVQHLVEVELRPFRHAIANGLAALMTAHVLYPVLDPKWPATLSQRIITGLLRQQMGFKGVVMTDDLEMKAIALPSGEAAVQALTAGADMILICHDEAKQWAALGEVQRAIKDKRLTEERIDQSILRVLKLKERFILPYEPAHPKQAKATVGRPAHRRLSQEIARGTEKEKAGLS
jgi:beta-N-acetylhexosaminidase